MDRRTPDTEDDNYTIADMSGVRRASWHLGGAPDGRDATQAPASDFGEELQGPEERLMVILGTMKAALSLGMVYVVGFGIAIALMVWLWN